MPSFKLGQSQEEGSYSGTIVSDKVCLEAAACVDGIEYLDSTTDDVCVSLFGIAPLPDSSSPNLITAIKDQKLIKSSRMTLYLDWNESDSRIDIGEARADLIKGDWTEHYAQYGKGSSGASSLNMTGFHYNGVSYLAQ